MEWWPRALGAGGECRAGVDSVLVWPHCGQLDRGHIAAPRPVTIALLGKERVPGGAGLMVVQMPLGSPKGPARREAEGADTDSGEGP